VDTTLDGFIADEIGRCKVVLSGRLPCVAGIFIQGSVISYMMLPWGTLIDTLEDSLRHELASVCVENIPGDLRGICLTLVFDSIALFCRLGDN